MANWVAQALLRLKNLYANMNAYGQLPRVTLLTAFHYRVYNVECSNTHQIKLLQNSAGLVEEEAGMVEDAGLKLMLGMWLCVVRQWKSSCHRNTIIAYTHWTRYNTSYVCQIFITLHDKLSL